MTTILPPRQRRINYVAKGGFVDRPRGRELFEAQARIAPEMIRVGINFEVDRDRCGLWIVLMPSSENIAALLEDVSGKKCPCRSIVDVHADFWSEDAQPIDGSGRPVIAEWRDNGLLDQLERCMRAADVVTVPRGGLVGSVSQFNQNIAVVPDMPDDPTEEQLVAVSRGWVEAISIASARPHSSPYVRGS
jgi:hypothetical protein